MSSVPIKSPSSAPALESLFTVRHPMGPWPVTVSIASAHPYPSQGTLSLSPEFQGHAQYVTAGDKHHQDRR